MTELCDPSHEALPADRAAFAEVARRLPSPEGTKYPYDLVVIDGRTAYLAGQIPKRDGQLALAGKVGREVSVEDAAAAARICAEQAMAWLNHSAGGLENLRRILRLTCYVAHEDGFENISAVADGASICLIEMLGDPGRHARSVIGVRSLPRNAPVLVEVTASLLAPPAP
ncbi:RidA family protein [Maritalea mobilis]|uniref:RidA family protein n=1 Tax=Maritalea mobilis TaxID=483324 RepID=UPI001C97FFD4|nr:RidA family protein [Maritalea mobilis]MBY6201430.1 RidA family protein [Maritalea mobilis]